MFFFFNACLPFSCNAIARVSAWKSKGSAIKTSQFSIILAICYENHCSPWKPLDITTVCCYDHLWMFPNNSLHNIWVSLWKPTPYLVFSPEEGLFGRTSLYNLNRGIPLELYVMHIYTSQGKCLASFTKMTWKLWKEFETRHFINRLTVRVTNRQLTSVFH